MTIKFQKVLGEAIIPHYAHIGDAGMDIFSAEDAVIKAGELSETKRGGGGFGSTGLFKK